MVQTAGFHGVFAVVVAGFIRQDLLVVSEAHTIIVRVIIGATGQDIPDHQICLIGKFREGTGWKITDGVLLGSGC